MERYGSAEKLSDPAARRIRGVPGGRPVSGNPADAPRRNTEESLCQDAFPAGQAGAARNVRNSFDAAKFPPSTPGAYRRVRTEGNADFLYERA